MKREGRQHGMVRTQMLFPLNNKNSQPTTATAAAGIFTRVPRKPTNHSKFTGKCSGQPGCLTCHQHPSTKSKNKTKGTQKLNSNDVVSNARLLSWRLVDNDGIQKGLNFNLKYSASNILDQLESSYHSSNSFYDDADDSGGGHDGEVFLYDFIDKERQRKILELRDHDVKDDDDDEAEEEEFDDVMSFCELGFVMYDEVEGDEDWCVVAEL